MDTWPEAVHACHKPGAQRIAHGIRLFRGFADQSEAGTGKTWRALAAAKILGVRPFVICPKSVIPDWRNAMWAVGVEGNVINYEAIRTSQWWIGGKRGTWNTSRISQDRLFIFDEAHRLGGRGTWWSTYGKRAWEQQYRVLLLSATLASSPLQLKTIGYILGLHTYSDFWYWAGTQGAARNPVMGYVELSPKKAAEAMKRIGDQLRSRGKSYTVGLRELVGMGFPENNITTKLVACADAAKIQATYAEMAAELERLQAEMSDATTILTLQLRYRQIIELLKAPAIAEMAKEYLETSNASIAIFVNFRATAAALEAALAPCSVICGEQSPEGRLTNIANFQNGTNRVCIATISAGGASINLHDEAGDRPRIALISPTYSAVDLRQVLGRCHRLTSKSPTYQAILMVADTIEERVYDIVKGKLANIAALSNQDLIGL